MATSSSPNKPELQNQLQFKQLALNAILEVTQAINNNLSADELFRIYEFILRAQFDIKRLCVFIKDEENQWYRACQYGMEDQDQPLDINVENDVSNVKSITSITGSHPKKLQPFSAIIPVYHKENALAYTLAGPVKQAESVKEEALKFIQTLTNIIVVAIENKKLFRQQLQQEALRKELELAAEIQSTLVPKSLPDDSYIDIKSIYKPYGEVGGDYYDVFSVNPNELIICIGDVSGKGMAAAMLMSNFQAHLRALAENESSLTEIVKKLNERMLQNTEGEKFITFFLGQYNTLDHTLSYINAGHNPPYLLKQEQITPLETGTTVLGMFEVLPFINADQIKLQKNDLIFLYTDGLIDVENKNQERFKTESVEKFLSENKDLSPQSLNDKLLQTLNDYRQEQPFTDDVTIISGRIKQ